jgi:hypothetical protein
MFLLNFQRIAAAVGNFKSFTSFKEVVAAASAIKGIATVGTVEGGFADISLTGAKFVIERVEEEAFGNAAELEVVAFADSLRFVRAPITKTASITAELDYKKTPTTCS